MPVITSFDQLEQVMRLELMSAMHEAQDSIENVMKEETNSFYSQGTPKLYDRTGMLGDSPRVSSVNGTGDTYEFKAYLDQNLWHLVPNPVFTDRGYASYFSTLEVYTAAENHTAHVLGKPGFWRRSEARFPQELEKAMRNHFS